MLFKVSAVSLVWAVIEASARAQTIFAQPAANGPAASALQAIGLAIVGFSGLVSVSVLVAGLWSLVRRNAGRNPRHASQGQR